MKLAFFHSRRMKPCRHIVSSQVYGSKKASNKPADKWLALSVDYLMQKYPALRVAYIDTAPSLSPRGKGTPMSVLLRWNAEEEKVQECYRVRLPDQLEDARGVVRVSNCDSFWTVWCARDRNSCCNAWPEPAPHFTCLQQSYSIQ
jgi:hypothetical protein